MAQGPLAASLADLGLRFRTVTVVSEGDYPVADADWNYKDVPHLNEVHGWADNVACLVEPHAVTSVTLQRVLGLRLPVVLSHYDSGPERQTYVFTLLTYTIITETHFERSPAGRTRVVTTYAVGAASRAAMLLFPLVRWSLVRNYRRLMTEDLPMRDRRGQLRRWGYSFRNDEGTRRFVDSLAIERDNLVPPADAPEVPAAGEVALADLAGGAPALWGRSDHLGLRLEGDGDVIRAYPRLCRHEGACLDSVAAQGADGSVRCPWHGRRVPPLGTLAATDGATLETEHHVLRVEGHRVRIRARVAAPAD